MKSKLKRAAAAISVLSLFTLATAPALADDEHSTGAAAGASQTDQAKRQAGMKGAVPRMMQSQAAAEPTRVLRQLAHDTRRVGMMDRDQRRSGMPGRGMGPSSAGPGMMDQDHLLGMKGMMGSSMSVGDMMGRDMDDHDQGLRVVPIQHLSADDVRHFFEHWVDASGNDRLMVGKVGQKDDDTLTAVIETVDGSLVRRFAIDRHTGQVRPETVEP